MSSDTAAAHCWHTLSPPQLAAQVLVVRSAVPRVFIVGAGVTAASPGVAEGVAVGTVVVVGSTAVVGELVGPRVPPLGSVPTEHLCCVCFVCVSLRQFFVHYTVSARALIYAYIRYADCCAVSLEQHRTVQST